jgi:hypothetical protein
VVELDIEHRHTGKRVIIDRIMAGVDVCPHLSIPKKGGEAGDHANLRTVFYVKRQSK